MSLWNFFFDEGLLEIVNGISLLHRNVKNHNLEGEVK